MVYLVEDDQALAEALGLLLASRGLGSEHFSSGEAFLAAIDSREHWARMPGCTILDVRLKQMSGLEVFDAITRQYPEQPIPIIFLTGHGDVEMAVLALKKGAFDFVQKPFNDNRLVDRVIEAIAVSQTRIKSAAHARALQTRLDRLSAREHEVLGRIVQGKLNKLIAAELGISTRTVEVHRANVFEKMQVRSAVELARLLDSIADT
jgi:two-component system, LuxR family, response regulator DctR